MNKRWKEIWNAKGKDYKIPAEGTDEFAVYRELKRLDGFDVSVGDPEAYYRSFYDSAVNLWENMRDLCGVHSAYEVGCGSGANLYLLKNRGIDIGGIDYAQGLVHIAQDILGNDTCITAGEALDLETDQKFDMVFSDGVFAYFPDETYGKQVLEKMFEKARKVIILSEVFDKTMQKECEEHRREMVDDYDERYEGLDKIFYSKDLFMQFAKDHGCKIEFDRTDNKNYWNSRYLFNCYLYK